MEALRRGYGQNFLLVGAYTPKQKGMEYLAKQIAASRQQFVHANYLSVAEELYARDEQEFGKPYGQNVQNTFPLADVFVDCSDENVVSSGITRFIELLFGHPNHTPTRDELAMFQAQGAALRSADLSRQVGSAIATAEGDILAIGSNEVPKAGGGQYWVGDDGDGRDYINGIESNTTLKLRMLADLLGRLKSAGWLAGDGLSATTNPNELAERVMSLPEVKGSRVLDVIEFGRTVHAEMAAIVECARRGVSVAKGILYTTTFPCHDCAKHIVAAGLSSVVYIEPYPKSLSLPLYPDSIVLEGAGVPGSHVVFRPFVGIAPRQYVRLFTAPTRKTDSGQALKWLSAPLIPRNATYEPIGNRRELELLREFEERLNGSGLQL